MRRIPSAPLIFAAYLIAACVVTYPLITVISTHLIGHPFGDSTEYTAHIAWIARALREGANPFIQPHLLYPDGLSAAWLWAVPLQSFPAVLIVLFAPDQLAFAFNASVLLALALNGLSMFLFVRAVLPDSSRRGFAAFTAGLIYLTFPAFGGHMGAGHLGLLALWGAPLFALFLVRLRDHPRPLTFVLAGVFFAVSALGSIPLLLYMTLPVTLILLIQPRIDRHTLIRQGGAIILGGLILLIFVAPYLIDSSSVSITPPSGIIRYSASPLAIVSPSPVHPLYRGLGYNGQVIGGEPFETTAYLGIVGLILSGIGIITARKSRIWWIGAVIAWVFSLGAFLRVFDQPVTLQIGGYATRIALPYLLIHDLPFVNLSRTPARFIFAVGFALAVMSGYGAAWLYPRVKRFAAPLMLVLCAVLLVDTRTFWEMPVISAAIPAIRDSGARAVFDVPFDHPLVDKEALYLQSAHRLPLIGGHIARETPLDPAKGALLQDTLDPALLDVSGVDLIILHREWADAEGELERRLYERYLTPIYADARFVVFRVPEYSGGGDENLSSLWSVRAAENGAVRVSIFTPTPSRALLTGSVNPSDARGASLILNGVSLLEWSINGAHGLRVPLDLPAGYSMLMITPDPSCEIPVAPLVCRALDLQDLTLEFVP